MKKPLAKRKRTSRALLPASALIDSPNDAAPAPPVLKEPAASLSTVKCSQPTIRAAAIPAAASSSTKCTSSTRSRRSKRPAPGRSSWCMAPATPARLTTRRPMAATAGSSIFCAKAFPSTSLTRSAAPARVGTPRRSTTPKPKASQVDTQRRHRAVHLRARLVDFSLRPQGR